jgi:hypothetical protein
VGGGHLKMANKLKSLAKENAAQIRKHLDSGQINYNILAEELYALNLCFGQNATAYLDGEDLFCIEYHHVDLRSTPIEPVRYADRIYRVTESGTRILLKDKGEPSALKSV